MALIKRAAVRQKPYDDPLTINPNLLRRYHRTHGPRIRRFIKSYLGEGWITYAPCIMDGGIAVWEIPNLQALMKFMCKNGFKHHMGMVSGHVAEILEEAIGNYLGWELYRHG